MFIIALPDMTEFVGIGKMLAVSSQQEITFV